MGTYTDKAKGTAWKTQPRMREIRVLAETHWVELYIFFLHRNWGCD